MTKILIPMAGLGTRFREAGYNISKPMIMTTDRRTLKKIPMVICATMDLPYIENDGNNIIYVDRKCDKELGIEDEIKKYYPKATFITIDEVTKGQACSCLLAEELINNDEPLLIAGCDNGMSYNKKKLEEVIKNSDVVAFTFTKDDILMFNPSAYGWYKINDKNEIIEASIKKALSDNPINDHAATSAFYFKKGSIFVETAKRMIKENDRINNEFYVDQSIKWALELGYKARIFDVEKYIGWGTPKDYENYEKTIKYWKEFYNSNSYLGLSKNSNNNYKPFVIGICGDSGSGKTTVVDSLINTFKEVLLIEGDNYHKWERGNEHYKTYTHLNPEANFLEKQADDLSRLKKGNSIELRDYNHKNGRFDKPHIVTKSNIIIENGLHTFYLESMRNLIDLKIYIDTEKELKTFWKIKRDCEERGYSKDEILKSIKFREKDYLEYIYPQIKYADLIISFYSEDKIKNDNPLVGIKLKFNKNINLTKLLTILKKYDCNIKVEKIRNKQVLVISSNCYNNKNIPFDKIIYKEFNLDNLLEIKKLTNIEVIVMLAILFIINEMRNSSEVINCNTVL